MFVLPARLRRIVYCLVFELLAIATSGPLLWALGGGDPIGSWTVAAIVSLIAVAWNYVFNTLFEAWEGRQGLRSRSLGLRCVHATLFETGLFLATVPLYMAWYGVGLWQAFRMEVALLLFFLVFTFVFTWAFDRLFVLPNALRPHGA